MEAQPRFLKFLDAFTVIIYAIGIYLVFFFAPEEATMGQVQRVFYFHVASAWTGMLGFLAAAIAGVIYLRTSKRIWDTVSLAAVEISVVFLLITIITGSIWARPIWNTWWTWDPRLTTATIMELIFVAYLMLRQGLEDPDRRARFGAVYVIIGALTVPITFLSIRIFRTIHPVVIGSGDPNATGTFDMSPKMLVTFLFGLFTYTILFITLFWHRIRMGVLAEHVEEMRLKISQ